MSVNSELKFVNSELNLSQRKAFYWQRIPETSCVRKDNTLVTSKEEEPVEPF